MPISDSFVFDDRSLQTLLTQFREYSKLISFDEEGAHWDKFFFNKNQTPGTLAALMKGTTPFSGELSSHQAFLLAFFRMLETTTRLTNRLPARHKDFYFKEVLKAMPRAAVADSILLTFTPEQSYSELNLPAGLVFEGARDSKGESLLYALDNDVLINHAQWTNLYWIDDEQITTVLDRDNKIEFPAAGVRLFSKNETTSPVSKGSLLILPELKALTGRQRAVCFALTEKPQSDVFIDVTSGNEWLSLGKASWDEESKSLRTSLPDTLDLSESPVSIKGYPFIDPMVRLRNQGSTLPEIKAVFVSVAVATNVDIRSKDGVTGKASSAGYVFGLHPAKDDIAEIMSPSWCHPELQFDITLQPAWEERPADFRLYYNGYPDEKSISNSVFKIRSQQPDGQEVESELFGDSSVDNPIIFHRAGANCTPEDNERYWGNATKLVLSGTDFQHSEWKNMSAEGDINDAMNVPYTPHLESIEISWTATTGVMPEQYKLDHRGLPASSMATSTDDVISDESKALYFGFKGVVPGQQLSIYFALSTPIPFEPEAIEWKYQSKNSGWKSLSNNLLEDTDNFSRSGAVTVTLPDDAGTDPKGQYCLSATGFIHQSIDAELPQDVRDDVSQPEPERWPWLKGVWMNGAMATLTNASDIADDHFNSPLTAGSISRTVSPFRGLAGISQPTDGEVGKPPESDESMMLRVAHLVANRGRASTWRDISQLITDNFPDVHHVRLPGVKILDGLYMPPENTPLLVEDESQGEPRIQEIMLVPRAGVNEGQDPERPVFSPAYLQRVKNFISERASPWLNLHVLNPYYLTVTIEYDVQWKEDANPSNAAQLLEKAIRRHFMPWLQGDTQVILGSRLTINDILLIMQRDPRVSLIRDVKINGCHEAIDTTLAVITIKF